MIIASEASHSSLSVQLFICVYISVMATLLVPGWPRAMHKRSRSHWDRVILAESAIFSLQSATYLGAARLASPNMRSDLDEHPSVSTVVALSVYNNILGTQTAAQGRAYIRIHVYTCIHIQNYNIYIITGACGKKPTMWNCI